MASRAARGSTSPTRRSTGTPPAPADRVALRWLGRDGTRRDFTYAELRDLSNRFANALRGLGVAPGDRVVSLLGRVPELHIAALGTWKLGAIFCPLFSAFGPEPIRTRLEKSGARVLVTTATLYQRKVAANRAALPALEHVILVGGADARAAGTRRPRLVAAARRRRARSSPFRRPIPRRRRSSTSPAARPACPRARSTCMGRCWRTMSPAGWPSTSIPATSSGAPPTRDG